MEDECIRGNIENAKIMGLDMVVEIFFPKEKREKFRSMMKKYLLENASDNMFHCEIKKIIKLENRKSYFYKMSPLCIYIESISLEFHIQLNE